MKRKLWAALLALSIAGTGIPVWASPAAPAEEAVVKAGGKLSKHWTVKNENKDRWRLAGDGRDRIEIQSMDTNLWGPANNTANLFLRSLKAEDPRHFSVQVKINGVTESAPGGSWQQIGLMIHQDDDNFVQLARKHNMNDPKIQMASEKNQTLTEAEGKTDVGEETSYYLKIERKDNNYTGFYSVDGKNWETVTSVTTDALGDDVKIGLFAASKDGAEWIGFEDVSADGKEISFFADESEETAEIVSVDPVELETAPGVIPELPGMVSVNYSDQTAGQAAVTWERQLTGEDVSQEGTILLTGSVEGTDLPASLTVYVQDKPVFDETEWTGAPETFKVNVQEAHANFFPYQDEQTARAGDESRSEYYRLLNGTWKFHWAENPAQRAKHFQGEDFDDQNWDDIQVPCSWTMIRNEDGSLRYDHPIYTNTAWAWNGNDNTNVGAAEAPSYVNPVGSYRTEFELPEDWKDRKIFLNFDGVESAYYVWVNGSQVGYAEDTFTKKEFDITPYVKEGINTLAVQVYKWSDGSWQEDQDMLYYAGIFRDVYLTSKDSEAEIRDFEIVTDLDEEYRDSSLDIYMDLRSFEGAAAEGMKAEAKLLDKEQVIAELSEDSIIFENGNASLELHSQVENPKKWSAENPYLYDLVLTLSNGERVLETTAVKVGFREMEIKGQGTDEAQMYINGKSIFVKGINRQELNENTGRYVTKEQMEEEFQLMKRSNINALRMGHYPNAPYVYDLCDKYGIYVMSEANVETHGNQGGVSGNPAWGPAVMDRVVTMFEQQKNHASVVFWSVGNEQGAYDVNKATYYKLKELDRSKRVVNYDQDQTHSDIISQGYRLPGELPGFQGKGKPYLMLEYAHAMGNSVGNLKELWNVIEDPRYPSVQGGFIWDWVDQALPSPVKFVKNETDGSSHIVTGELMMGRLANKENPDRSLRGYIDLEGTSEMETGDVFTFEADIKPDMNTGRTMVILSKGDGTQLRLVSNYRLEFEVNGKTVSYTVPGNSLKDSGWHRVTASFDRGEMKLFFDGSLAASGTAESAPVQNSADFVIGSNAQAMGNAFYGRIDNVHVYQKAVEGIPVTQTRTDMEDALIWCDMNGENVGSTGETYFAYGGDWMDFGNNGNFSVNGMLLPDKTIQPEFNEVKKVYQNAEITLKDPTGIIEVTNKSLFTNLDRYDLYWELRENNKKIESGALQVSAAPGETKEIQIPCSALEEKAGCEYWLNVEFRLKEAEEWANAGFAMIEEQLLLTKSAKPAKNIQIEDLPKLEYKAEEQKIQINGDGFCLGIDRGTGEITSFTSADMELVEQGPIPSYFRAPVDNDRGASGLFNQINRWQNAGTGRKVENVTASLNEEETMVTVAVTGTLPVGTSRFSMTYYIYGNGTVRVDHTLSPSGIGSDIIPVVGNAMRIPGDLDQISWYGKGPYETVSDRKTAAKVDVYNSTVEEQFFPYVRPQETGGHQDLRWMALTNKNGDGLLVSSQDTFSASAMPYTASEIATKLHPYQLKKEDNTVLRIDSLEMGVGGAHSWGSWPIEEYLIRADQDYTHTYFMTPVKGLTSEKAMEVSGTNYEVSARSIADSLTAVKAPDLTQTTITMPSVPKGFTVSIHSSDKPESIGTDAAVYFGPEEETVTLVLQVKKESDGTTALTGEIQVIVPRRSAYYPWRIIRENPDTWKFAEDGSDKILIKQTQGSHWDVHGVQGNNLFVVDPKAEDPENYSVTVRMTGVTTTGYQQAGLIIYKDDMHFVQAARMHKAGNPVLAMNSRNGGNDVTDIGTQKRGYTDETVYFKITRQGDQYTSFYSSDGKSWEELGTVVNSTLEGAGIGVFASSEESEDWFAFDKVQVDNQIVSFQGRESGLGGDWNIIRRNDNGWSVPDPAADQILLKPMAGTMLGESVTNSRNLVVTEAPSGTESSSYEISVKMTGKPETEGEAAGLLIYASDDRYVRVQREYREGKAILRFLSEDNGSLTGERELADPVQADTIYLKLTRNLQPIDTYTAYYSADGTQWKEMGTLNNTGIYGGFVGIAADGADTENSFVFEGFDRNKTWIPFGREIQTEKKYRISAQAGPGGRILLDPDQEEVKEHEDITFTVTADEGYRIETVTVNGKEITLENGSYTIRDIQENIEILASFAKDEPVIWPDTDVLKAVLEVLADTQGMTAESVKRYEEAVKEAEELLRQIESQETGITQEQVDEAVLEIVRAIAGLLPAEESHQEADLTSLRAEVSRAAVVDRTKYTEASLKVLDSILASAQKLLNRKPGKESQELADSMAAALKGAIDNLAEKPKAEVTEELPAGNSQHRVGNLVYRVIKSSARVGTAAVVKPGDRRIRDVKIPSEITLNGYRFRVTEVAKNAFKGCKKLRKVTIGNNVTNVKDSAFRQCTNLTKVTLGTGVTGIGRKAFYGDRKLKNIRILSKKLKKVYPYSFGKTNSRAVVRVPKTKERAYRKLLKNKGFASRVTIRK